VSFGSLKNHSPKRNPEIISQNRVRNWIRTCSVDMRVRLCMIMWHGEHLHPSVKLVEPAGLTIWRGIVRDERAG